MDDITERLRRSLPELIEVTLVSNGRRVVNRRNADNATQTLAPSLTPRRTNFRSNTFQDVPVFPSLSVLRNSSEIKIFRTLENNEQDTCSICRMEFEDDDVIRKLNNCNHIFHVNCIDIWFENNIRCPLCRRDLRNIELTDAVVTTSMI